MGRHSDVDFGELSYNERRIMRDLLTTRENELRAIITTANADLEIVTDLIERVAVQEDK